MSVTKRERLHALIDLLEDDYIDFLVGYVEKLVFYDPAKDPILTGEALFEGTESSVEKETSARMKE